MERLAAGARRRSPEPWARPTRARPRASCAPPSPRACEREPVTRHEPPAVPVELGRRASGTGSTQQALGRLFVDLVHEAPEVAEHVVTVSPDVAVSTNLGGWINKAGIWSLGDRIDWFADDTDTLVRWRESDHGRHLELGIAEVNLVGCSASWARRGRARAARCCPSARSTTRSSPARTSRGRSGSTPAASRSSSARRRASRSGPRAVRTSRSSRRRSASSSPAAWPGSRPSRRTSSGSSCTPCRASGAPGGASSYLRLSTRPIDQSLAAVPARTTPPARRAAARCSRAPTCCARRPDATVTIAVAGAPVVEALQAAEVVGAEVVCLTSADLVFRCAAGPPGPGREGSWERARPRLRRRRARSSPSSTATRTR